MIRKNGFCLFALASLLWLPVFFTSAIAQTTKVEAVPAKAQIDLHKAPVVPPASELNRAFGKHDEAAFLSPSKVYHPQTWFHYIGGNVGKAGITKDLDAVAAAGFSGIHLFHGQFGGPWPGVEPQITSLSENWDDAVKFTAAECKRLGLNFSMNNCPGWATAGGPWIEPSNAMRNLVWSRTDVSGGSTAGTILKIPDPSSEPWRDYQDVAVIAFPTCLDDTGKPLVPLSVKSDIEAEWKTYLAGEAKKPIQIGPADSAKPHWIEISFDKVVPLRSVEFSSVQGFNHSQSYEPGVNVSIQAVTENGTLRNILTADMPQSNFQDDQPITLACSEIAGIKKYRITIYNKYAMNLGSLRLFSAARKNNWESEAAWSLRSIERAGQHPVQSAKAHINPSEIIDLSAKLDKSGKLNWTPLKGSWTILRFGHVNSGKQNGPAPKEGTGWEANKLSSKGADAHFAGYIGRLSGDKGPLAGGLMNGMLIDSWECHTQTWTQEMEKEFTTTVKYPLRKWLPVLAGYVVNDHETSGRFLVDWRKTINRLFSTNFYGRMAELARKNGLSVTYETSAGDVLPGDIMEYFKYADVPMCEFWHPMSDNFVGSLNFKPIKPTVSAARMYGKPRIAAEAFTSFALTYDEHFDMLREVANVNTAEGMTHYIFHTYTHNPQQPFLPPGSSFGAHIGTPFLRGQTWWKYMPQFTDYLARCTYMLERGTPVSDVLWYLGDEINHKPDQLAPFPAGYKYDYCNPDVLLNRLKVVNGKLVTPEGLQYRVLWLPDVPRMLPETLEKILALVQAGATIVGDAPTGIATLSGGAAAKSRFDRAVKSIWGTKQTGKKQIGKGFVVSGLTLDEALHVLKISPDVTGSDALWVHRTVAGADWYFVSAPKGKDFNGELSFRLPESGSKTTNSNGYAELWNPVTGSASPIAFRRDGDRVVIKLELLKSNACFIVFRKDSTGAGSIHQQNVTYLNQPVSTQTLSGPWTLHFPSGWGAPDSIRITELKAWKELDIPAEGKAFSGTATYKTSFIVGNDVNVNTSTLLDLGKVDMAATVFLNGAEVGRLIAPPYQINLQKFLRAGSNQLTIEVTSTWFNRLVYDTGQPEDKRKTWTIDGPDQSSELRVSGLIGPVKLMQVSASNKQPIDKQQQ